MTRHWYIHQDSYIYIKIRIYTSRFVYIHQDSCIYSKIPIYTSRFVYIHQDSYVYIKICIYTLRFVQFRHKGKHDRWIDYRVFKRRSKNGSKWSLLRRVYRAMTEEITPASNVEEELSRVFFPRVGAQQPPLCNPRVNYWSDGSSGKKGRLRSSSWKVKSAKESPHSISC